MHSGGKVQHLINFFSNLNPQNFIPKNMRAEAVVRIEKPKAQPKPQPTLTLSLKPKPEMAIFTDFHFLPSNVFYNIAGNLRVSELCRFSRVNHQCYYFATQDELWKPLLSKLFPEYVPTELTKNVMDYNKFILLTKFNYPRFLPYQIKLFHIVIEGDESQILSSRLLGIFVHEMNIENRQKTKLVQYLRRLNNPKLNLEIFNSNTRYLTTNAHILTLIQLDLDDSHLPSQSFADIYSLGNSIVILDMHLWTWVVKYNSLNFAAMLIKAGITCNISHVNEPHPLYAAAEKGCFEMLNLLLVNGAQVNLVHQDKTALHAAVTSGHVEIVQRLLESGANINRHNSNLLGISTEMLALLLEYNLNLNQDEDFFLKLIALNKFDHLKVILEHYKKRKKISEISLLKEDGDWPLSVEVFKDQFSICQLLLSYGVDINCKTKSGKTLLHAVGWLPAAKAIPFIYLFIRAGVDPLQISKVGEYPSDVAKEVVLKQFMGKLEHVASQTLQQMVYDEPRFIDKIANFSGFFNNFIARVKFFPNEHPTPKEQILQAEIAVKLINETSTIFGAAVILFAYLESQFMPVIRFLENKTKDHLLKYMIANLGFANLYQARNELYFYVCQCLGESPELMKLLKELVVIPLAKLFINPISNNDSEFIFETLCLNIFEIDFKKAYNRKLENDLILVFSESKRLG